MINKRDLSWEEFLRQEKRHLTSNPYIFLVFFAFYYVILEVFYFLIPDPLLLHVIHHYGIVQPCADMLSFMAPHEGVKVVEGMLVSPRAILSIVRGCDGSGVIFLLASAILAYPTAWRRKICGIIGAFALICLFNQVRLIGLYFIAAYHKDMFTVLHTYFSPMLFIVISLLFFIYWSIHVRDSDAA
jgi:exosortase family protein XrtM